MLIMSVIPMLIMFRYSNADTSIVISIVWLPHPPKVKRPPRLLWIFNEFHLENQAPALGKRTANPKELNRLSKGTKPPIQIWKRQFFVRFYQLSHAQEWKFILIPFAKSKFCTTFSLREKALSLERTKKNEFSFGSLLAYSYLCKRNKSK